MADGPAPGSTLGSYRLTEQIGQGGMGVVFRGEHVDTGQVCALKILTPALAEEEGFRQRFEREFEYAGSLDHPNVVGLYDAGEVDGVLYMAMQFVDGTDLKAMLNEEGKLDPARAVEILSQVASALDAAHATGLLHRDVKPGNIMIEPGAGPGGSDRCYLTDFGLSKNPSSDSFALTKQGSFVGTIDYTAPEQILAKPFDHRVDVYSLACVLYECLTGEVPYPKARDVEVLYGHIQDPPPKLTEKRPDAPAELDDVIATAMAKKPDERYSSCTALLEAARAAAGVPEPAPAAPPAGAPQGEPVLKVVAGRAAGTQIPVAGEFLIGRHAEGDGKLGRDPEISRRHAMIRNQGGALVIEDLGSTNGTFVNGRRLDAPCPLSAGDRIELGDTTLEVVVVPAAEPVPGATLFAPIPSSTPPSQPAAEVSEPLPPVEEGEHPEAPDRDLPTMPLKAVDRGASGVAQPPPEVVPPSTEGPPEQPVTASKDALPVPGPAAPALGAEGAAPRGRVVLRVELDLDSGEVSVGVEDGPGVRVTQDAEGRWTVEPE